MPGFGALSEGTHTIYFKASDNASNVMGDYGEWSWQFFKDTVPPTDPTSVNSTSHTTKVWSSDNTVDISWADATDSTSLLDGYSILWNTDNATAIPDTNKDIEEGVQSANSTALADGSSHYFHIRSVDNAGNWQSTVHVGPFLIETVPPTDPTSVNSTSHSLSTWSSDNTVDIGWIDATDSASGLDGYSILWNTDNATAIPDTNKTIEEWVGSANSTALADGNSHYFHIRSKDNAGNWQSTVHLGPFFIDTTPPTDPTGVVSTSHTPSRWSSDNTVDITWIDATDSASGLDGYSVLWNTDNATAIPDTNKNIEEGVESANSLALADGNSHYFHIRSVDNAGNWQSTVHVGPFFINTSGFIEHTIADNFITAWSVYATDVDGDGDVDVLGTQGEATDITWWENDGSETFTGHTITDNFTGAESVYATDVDGDGDVDVLGTQGEATDITWWENDGSETFTGHTITDNFTGAESVYATDVDGDGDIDVLGAAVSADDITWWENDGSETFTEHTIDGDFDGAQSVYATDVDGDGDVDVLGAANSADDITWWENDGSETFTEHTIKGDFDGAYSVYATDVDGDGDVDVLGAAASADDITWWENDGSETFTEHNIAGNFNGACSVYATDVDGDGDTDVLGAAFGAHDITWWENFFASPTMEPILEAQGQSYSTAPSFSNFGFDDNVALDDGWYQMDSYTGSWTVLFTDNATPSWDDDNWTIPGFTALSQGSHTIYFMASDNASSVEGESGEWSWQFFKSTPSPPAPSGGGDGGGGGGGGGGGATDDARITGLSGTIKESGELLDDIVALSLDNDLRLDIPTGTFARNRNNVFLFSIRITTLAEPPEVSESMEMIGLAYELTPAGATFDPPIDMTIKYDVSLIPGGVAEKNLVVAWWDETASNWVDMESTVDMKNDTITVKVSHFTAFTILVHTRPASFDVEDLSIIPKEADLGERISVSALVTNTGDLTGRYEVSLELDDVVVQTKEVTLNGGDSEAVSFSVVLDTAGEHTVYINGLLGKFEVKAPPPAPVPAVAPAPPSFAISDLSVAPSEVKLADQVTISAVVTNIGGSEGSYTVVLKINGAEEARKEVTLGVGKSESVTFTISKDTEGSYTVNIAGNLGQFTVIVQPPPTPTPTEALPVQLPTNWWLIGGIIAGVVATGLVSYFVVRKRREAWVLIRARVKSILTVMPRR